MKWTMHNFENFSASENGLNIAVFKSSLGWAWTITKNGEVIDAAFYHPNAPTSELDAKVKAEKMFKQINQ